MLVNYIDSIKLLLRVKTYYTSQTTIGVEASARAGEAAPRIAGFRSWEATTRMAEENAANYASKKVEQHGS